MSTDELRRELARIGEGAPVAVVPDDTWTRARRARRKERLGAVAAAFVVLAMAVGLAAWLPGRSEVDPAKGGGVGVPETIHSVPGGTLEATADLNVGRAAAALMSDDDLPVVIDAADGTYTALSLPGFGALQRDQGVVSLSPDGRHLAWGWSSTESGGITATGVRILDLMTGEHRSIPSPRPIFVYSFTWSPDSRWLAWDGAEGTWSGNGFGTGRAIAGRIGPGGDVMTSVPRTSAESTRFAIDNDGTVLIATTDTETLWNGEVLDASPRGRGWYPEFLTPRDGVVLETIEHSDDPDNYKVSYRKPTPSGPVAAPALSDRRLVPLGWVGSSAVAMTQERGAESFELALVDLGGSVSVRKVGEVRGAFNVSVAVDLMAADRPTVDRPAPPWLHPDDGWSKARWSLTLALGVVVLGGIAAVLLWRRRLM